MSHPTVHVIDDDAAVRDALRLLLTTEGLEVVTHDSALGFLASIDRGSTGCVVTDVRMPEMTGMELLLKVKEMGLSLPVIVISAHADVPLAVQAMKEGALDLLEKPFDDEALLGAVRLGLAFDSGKRAQSTQEQEIARRLTTLTGRENEVLAGLLKGQPNKIIAHELGISVRTVEVHRANVMAKMQAGSLPELVRMSLTGQAKGQQQESEAGPPVDH
ncbi:MULTISPECIES: response regulator FixJ [Methylosinus]|uniref:DNA-binding response regulator n=1 Tax=Methylosinus trichosporium (strain ATCC 35070 / NCIMB 11131 / UNIQEM 75 / OB3b) TaxID=595536 RepID=A0A2D2CZL7_METT3|nr:MULTISPECIES: response regulator FixJ [Methylosinus]ATQ68187.1 DNA-binding response regulator [Methylosinus trichosporium OB3b]OBS53452.1 DNA-binding response regulator [Methylosinus sp. 3S-1]